MAELTQIELLLNGGVVLVVFLVSATLILNYLNGKEISWGSRIDWMFFGIMAGVSYLAITKPSEPSIAIGAVALMIQEVLFFAFAKLQERKE